MPLPICVPCQRYFRPHKNGVKVLEYGDKVWNADKYKCGGCGAEIVVGFGCAPVAEHFQPGFAAQQALATVFVKE